LAYSRSCQERLVIRKTSMLFLKQRSGEL
jgi:hypothetical protein